MRLLFITSTRIGDAVLSSGLLAHLLETNPGARLWLACGRPAAPLFAGVPGLERLIVLDKRRFGLHWLVLWWAAITRRWSLVVDLRGSALGYFLLTTRRLVFRSRQGLAHRVVALGALAHLREPPAPRLWTTEAAERTAAALIPDGPPVLALGPTANWAGKEWPIERFIELAHRLRAPGGILPGARVAIFGAPDERPHAEPLIAAIEPMRRLDLIGALDLLAVHAALKRCALFVGNDSGLMHLAAAAQVPTLGLFGPSRDEHYAPFGRHAASVRTPESYEVLIGRPGYDHRTTGTLMGGLTVDHVAIAAEALWSRVRAAAA